MDEEDLRRTGFGESSVEQLKMFLQVFIHLSSCLAWRFRGLRGASGFHDLNTEM